MNIILLAIGDELLKGETQDKNLYWLGKFLRSIGHHLQQCVFTKDTLNDISETLTHITGGLAPNLIIVSGGLGPTKDDLTKKAIAHFLNTSLQENDEAAKMTREHYQRLGKTWTPELNYYHLIPKNVTPVKNQAGLAPGLFISKNGTSILCAPGVPREFESMVRDFFHGHYREIIKENTGHLYIKTRGVPEEKIFNEISPSLWKDLENFGVISSYPRLTGIDILIDQIEESNIEKIKCLPSVKLIEPYIWQFGNLSLEEYIIKKLKEKSLSVATAESCTGGLVASLLTDVAGSSEVFIGSIVSYSNDIKIDELNVSAISIEKEGAVSEIVAKEMAIGARERFDVDISVSTSGIAGPGGGSTEKPVGTVAVGISFNGGNYSKIYLLRNEGRHQTKSRFAVCALLSLLHFVEKI